MQIFPDGIPAHRNFDEFAPLSRRLPQNTGCTPLSRCELLRQPVLL
jgi:hypothetical protein